jgi:hypothetical protein
MTDCPQGAWLAANLESELQKPEFSNFIRPWVMRSWLGTEPFERLIHLWVAFNAWTAETITPSDLMERDAALVAAASRDPELNRRFSFLFDNDTEFQKLAIEFRCLWPVFNVRRLDQDNVEPWQQEIYSRKEYRQMCFDAGASKHDMKPGCFLRHQNGEETVTGGDPDRVPLDWPHTLSAIYQVRCNLFHGGKSFRMPSDVRFAELAFEILWACWGSEFVDAQH